MENEDRVLDWVPGHDPRNLNYPLRADLARSVERKRKVHWVPGRRIDQGNEGACVSFGLTNLMMTWPRVLRLSPKPVLELFARAQYRHFQRRDEWRDAIQDAGFGTSTNAGVGTLMAAGAINGYRWGFGADDVIDQVCTHVSRGGSAVGVGTVWLDSMYDTPSGALVDVSGRPVGGHFYVISGYHPSLRLWREGWRKRHEALQITNSWGSGWGTNGKAWITVEDFAGLLAQRGEAVVFEGTNRMTVEELMRAERDLPSIAGTY